MTAAVAGIRSQLAESYLADLEKYAAGDDARFARMVDGRGKGLGNEDTWRKYVAAYLRDGDIADLVPERRTAIAQRAEALGIEWKGDKWQ